MIETEDIVIVAGCSDKEALRLEYVQSVLTFRQVSADFGALPDAAPLQRYLPLVIALRDAVRNANQALVNYLQHGSGKKC